MSAGALAIGGGVAIRMRRSFEAGRRELVFRRAIRKFLQDPKAYTDSGNRVFADLIYGWGNGAWSALNEYLAACVEHALRADGPILECGSGLSTIVAGAVAESRGNAYLALEHMPEWADRVQRRLRRYRIDTPVISVRPLKDYPDFSWYDPPIDKMPDNLALVICDGPPGDTRGGRYGLVPMMRERLKPGCVVLLDDAGRREEREIAERWKAEYGAQVDVLGSRKPFIKLTLGR